MTTTSFDTATDLLAEWAAITDAINDHAPLSISWAVGIEGDTIRFTDLSAQERLRDILCMHIAKIEDRLKQMGAA